MTAIKKINNTSIAKRRFADAVSGGIEQLMKEGFNREHSTAMILNCLRRKETHEDKEVFKVVNSFGVNLNEAVTAITVASALRQVMSTRGLSAAEAINVLTERIKSSLERPTDIMSVSLSGSDIYVSGGILHVHNKENDPNKDIRYTSRRPHSNMTSTSKSHPTRIIKKVNVHSFKNSALRRRASKAGETPTVQESSTSDDTKAKIELVTKTLLNHEDVNINKDSVLTKVSLKRNRSAITEGDNQLQSPVKKNAKRPRV